MDNLNLLNPEEFNFMAHNTDTLKKVYLSDIIACVPKKRNVNNDIIYKAIAVSCASDIGNVNYNKYGEAGHILQAINKEPFCDNILLGVYIPKELLKINNDDDPEEEEEEEREKSKEEHEEKQYKINSKMSIQRTEILNFFVNRNIQIKPYDIQPLRIRPCDNKNHNFIAPDKETIKRVYKKYALEYNDKSTLYVQIFKVALSSEKFNTILNLFNDDNIKTLLNLNLKVYDIDFTIDYINSFDKKLLWDHLLTNHNFMISCNNKGDQEEEEDKDYIINKECGSDNLRVLINNDNFCGRDCLSYLFKKTRCKIYNKFVQGIQIKSVRNSCIGSNLPNFINNPEPRLQENIKACIPYGITRQEITFYRYQDHGIPSKQEILDALQEQIEMVPKEITYKTPIQEQFKAYTESIKHNILIVNLEEKSANLIYSVNKITQRAGGIKFITKKNNLDKADILYLLSYATADLPIIYILVDVFNRKDTTDDKAYINMSYRYLLTKPKTGEPKTTNIIKNDNLYYSLESLIKTKFKINTPQEMGLIDTPNFKLRIPPTNNRRLYNNSKFKFNDHFYFILLPIINELKINTYKRNNKLKIAEELFKNNNDDKFLNITNYNNDQFKNLLNVQKIADEEEFKCNNILDLLKKKSVKKLNSLSKDYKLSIIGIRPIKTVFNNNTLNNYILVNNDGALYYSISNITAYINILLQRKALIKNEKYNLITFGEQIIFKFKIDAIYTNNNITYVQTSKIQPHEELNRYAEQQTETNEDIKKYNDLRLNNNIPAAVKIACCKKIDDLEEGREILITGIKTRESGKKTKYIFYVEGIKEPFISNIFLEDLIKKYDLINKIHCKFKIIIGTLKRTASKNLCRNIIIPHINEIINNKIIKDTAQKEEEEGEINLNVSDYIEEVQRILNKEEIKNIVIEPSKLTPKIKEIKEKDGLKLEDTNLFITGAVITINKLWKTNGGKDHKYLFKTLQHGEQLFISNSFLEELIILHTPEQLINKSFKIEQLKTNKNKKKLRNIILIEDTQNTETETQQQIKRSVLKEKDAYKMEDEIFFKDGNIITISNIWKKEGGTKNKFFFTTTEHKENIFISNKHLEDLITDYTDEKLKLLINSKIEIAKLKYTTTKKLLRNVILIN
jgi:hypothetical protein